VREFGRLVDIEIAKGNKVEAAMEIVRRRKPGLCNSRSKAYELWAEYKTNKTYKAEADRRRAGVMDYLASDPKFVRWARRRVRWQDFKRRVSNNLFVLRVRRQLRWQAFKMWVASIFRTRG
jgi:hypothetical protein